MNIKGKIGMKTVRLDISDNVYDKVMFFLTNLPQNEVHLNIEDNLEVSNVNILKAVSLKTRGFKFDREEANAR